jgi:tRNA (guanine26-N2/guanine27-N2)-dimethyltransferase
MSAITGKIVQEGISKIHIPQGIFYNPVQEFNRDLSVAVLYAFQRFKLTRVHNNKPLVILDALSASGFRAIRYAQQIPAVGQSHNGIVVIANDMDSAAEDAIKGNIRLNTIPDSVRIQINISDAKWFMYQCAHNMQVNFNDFKYSPLDIIDLDPYGTASPFFDAAIQSISDGGLLCVTCTDMAVLAGVHPDTCYAKYGSVPLHTEYGQEMAVRIVLSSLDQCANRYQKYIEPLICMRIDFYVRLFVRVHKSALQVKHSISKKSMVLACRQCKSFTLHPLGISSEKKFSFPAFMDPISVSNQGSDLNCSICNIGTLQLGGPIWSAPICDLEFANSVIGSLDNLILGTKDRIRGMLSVLSEELPNQPLYLSVSHLSKTLRCICPPLITVKSALLHAGYSVSITHCDPLGIKTNATLKFLWDLMRAWKVKTSTEQSNQAKQVDKDDDQHGSAKAKCKQAHYKIASAITSKPPTWAADFFELDKHHPLAKEEESRQKKLVRFAILPDNWGPLAKAKHHDPS